MFSVAGILSATLRQNLIVVGVFALSCTATAVAQGWKQMEASYNATRAQCVQQGFPSYYITPHKNGNLVWDPRPEFGIGAHGVTSAMITNLHKANIRFLRYTLYWNTIEDSKTPNKYNLNALKQWGETMALLKREGIIPVVVVHGNPPGASFTNRVASYRRFANFMEMMVSRYPDVRYWELFNEMDGAFTDLFGAGVQPEIPMRQRGRYYVEMLKLVYPRIKAANPKALVVHGGLSDYNEFPKGVYEAGGRDFFDVMNLHTYGIPLTWSFVLRGQALRQLMREYGDGAKPLWNTEFGIDAAAVVRAWGVPKENVGARFDQLQDEMISACLEFNNKAGLYQKCFAYQYAAANEAVPDELKTATNRLPANMTLDDYGFGFVRRDGVTMRPVLQHLIERKVNDPARLLRAERHRLTNTSVETVSLQTDYPTLVKRR